MTIINFIVSNGSSSTILLQKQEHSTKFITTYNCDVFTASAIVIYSYVIGKQNSVITTLSNVDNLTKI